jgi:hypothetical protein
MRHVKLNSLFSMALKFRAFYFTSCKVLFRKTFTEHKFSDMCCSLYSLKNSYSKYNLLLLTDLNENIILRHLSEKHFS